MTGLSGSQGQDQPHLKGLTIEFEVNTTYDFLILRQLEHIDRQTNLQIDRRMSSINITELFIATWH